MKGHNEMRKTEIRPNNCASNDPCAFCSQRTDPQIPFAIFKYGTYAPVCDDCAESVGALQTLCDISLCGANDLAF